MVSKSSLAVFLSKLKSFENPSLALEQYITDSEIAAEIVWSAYMNKDIEDKVIADFGCGTGILGIAALILGAKKVYFIDIDKEALAVLKENLAKAEDAAETSFDYEIINDSVENFKNPVDLIIQNPPFGTKVEHADKAFLEKSFQTASKIYSFHKTSTRKFIEAISADHGFKIAAEWTLQFPIKKTHAFHKKKLERVEVSVFRLEK